MAPLIPAVNPAGQMVQGKTLCLDLHAGAEPDAGFLAVEAKTKNWPLLLKVKRLSELLESKDVNEALAALTPVDDAPSMKSDPPVDLRVPYPWRKH